MIGRSSALRPTLIFSLLFIIGGVFLFSLYQHQVLQHNDYKKIADEQSTSTDSQPAQRGQIFAQDKDGKLFSLAVSDWRYSLQISPRQVKNKEKLVAALKEDIPDLSVDDVLSKINNDKLYIPPVIKGLDSDTADKLQKKDYAGVFLIPELERIYPDGSNIASQVIGFVGGDNQGKYGVEAVYDDQLKGKNGSQDAKRDSLGRLIDILSAKEPTPGDNLVLTIDYNLQFTIEQKLKEAITQYQADSGEIIVMNPKNGAVLAVAGQPTFDPNNYSEVKGEDQRNFLLRAASDVYEPGSVFKPLAMAMAINEGLLTPDTTNTFAGSVTVDGHQIHNALFEDFGKETMTQVLENSDNIAMTWVSSLIGADKERDYYEKMGIGQKSGIDVVGEQSGSLQPKSAWNDLLRSTAAFGQGVSVNLVQLAKAYSIIANGGKTVTPHFVDHLVQGDQNIPQTFPDGTQVITADTAAKVRQMLVSVVELGLGKKAKVDGVSVGGKTGTAQVPDGKGGYDPSKSIGTFAGMFPADDPKFVMVVRLDNPKSVNFAESSAAPTFGAIANWMTNYYQLR